MAFGRPPDWVLSRWLTENGVDLAAGQEFMSKTSQLGDSVVGIALDNALAGLFAVRDGLKPGAREVVTHIQRQGLEDLPGDRR